jgi:hypothetical protein
MLFLRVLLTNCVLWGLFYLSEFKDISGVGGLLTIFITIMAICILIGGCVIVYTDKWDSKDIEKALETPIRSAIVQTLGMTSSFSMVYLMLSHGWGYTGVVLLLQMIMVCTLLTKFYKQVFNK